MSSSKGTVLVVVFGLTPQVVTETLYCLTQVKKTPINVSLIKVITTSKGKEYALESLLDPGSGKFYEFCREYDMDPGAIDFGEDDILVLKDRAGNPVSDIRSIADNEAAADQIAQLIRELTSDPRLSLHCSAAGGRKTMGIYLACALQLFGRPEDILSHVLVSEDFESHPDFFYKPKRGKILEVKSRDGEVVRRLNTDDARIELAEIPYVRVREKIEGIWDLSKMSYIELVRRAQREMDLVKVVPDMVLNVGRRTLVIGDREISFPPMLFALYCWYAGNKLDRCPEPEKENCEGCSSCYVMLQDVLDPGDEVLRIYEKLRPGCDIEKRRTAWANLDADDLRSYISKINRQLKEGLGERRLSLYFEVRSPELVWGSTRYGIAADRSKIKVI